MENQQDSVNQRFTKLLRMQKISQKTFSETTGLNERTISNIVNGITNYPKADLFIAIAQHFPHWNLRWILLGEDPQILEEGEDYIVKQEAPPGDRVDDLLASIKELSATVSALTKISNDLPEMRERIRDLEAEISRLKETNS